MITLGRRPFAELFAKPTDLAHAIESLTTTIHKSFRDPDAGAMREPTAAEVKRRLEICEKWFRTLRADFKWSIDRTLSELPRALAAELGGRPYKPVSRTLWTPPGV